MNAGRVAAFFLAVSLLAASAASAVGLGSLPGETLAAIEVVAPAERLRDLSDRQALPALGLLAAAASSFGGEDAGWLGRLARVLSLPPQESGLLRQVEDLAGRRLLLAALPGRGAASGAIALVLVAEADDAAAQRQALATLAGRLLAPGARVTGGVEGPITVVDGRGTVLAVGLGGQGRLVLAAPGSAAVVSSLAEAVASEAPDDLGQDAAFRAIVARLPASAPVHGFLRLTSLVRHWGPSAPAGLRAAHAALGGCEVLGFARALTAEGLRTWVAGRSCGLTRDLAPLGQPLSPLLPEGTLAAWDIGLTPVVLGQRLAAVVGTLVPTLAEAVSRRLAELREATGLDVPADVLGALGPGLALGVLPPDPAGGWPLPRPVWLLRVADRPRLERSLDTLFEWEAGAVADLTQGLASASLERETLPGATLTGLRVEGLLDVPYPSPTAAVAGGLLVVSPVRSAVRETVEVLRQRRAVSGPTAEAELLRVDLARLSASLDAAAAGKLAAVLGMGREREAALAASSLTRAGAGAGPLRAAARVERDASGTWLLVDAELRLPGYPGVTRTASSLR